MVIFNNTHGHVRQNYHYSKHLQVNTTSTRQLPGLGEDMVKPEAFMFIFVYYVG